MREKECYLDIHKSRPAVEMKKSVVCQVVMQSHTYGGLALTNDKFSFYENS